MPQNWRLVEALQLALKTRCWDGRYQWLTDYHRGSQSAFANGGQVNEQG
jgi:hypothetical protein